MQKNKHILIGEPNETLRKGLRTIFTEEPGGTEVIEAATSEEFQVQLKSGAWDLVVVHQSMIADITLLPKDHFVVLAKEPDANILLAARLHGGRGYLLGDLSTGLMREILQLSEGSFLTDPAMSAWIVDYLAHHSLLSISHEALTSREEDVFRLLWRGHSKREIAEQLNLSPTTVKTHVKHIYEKLRLNRFQVKILSLLTSGDEQNATPFPLCARVQDGQSG